jgi:hypothetical protein
MDYVLLVNKDKAQYQRFRRDRLIQNSGTGERNRTWYSWNHAQLERRKKREERECATKIKKPVISKPQKTV